MEEQHAHHAHDDQHTVLIVGVAGQIQHAKQNCEIGQKDQGAADEAPGLANGGVDEVRPVRGHVVQLAHGAVDEHAFAGEAAGTDGDLRLSHLVCVVQGRKLRVEERQDAGKAVVVDIKGDHSAVERDEGQGDDGSQRQQQFHVDVGEEEHDGEEEDNHDQGAGFARGQNDDAGNADLCHDANKVRNGGKGTVLLGKVLGEHQDHGQFDELGGLDGVAPDNVCPGSHALGSVCHQREENQGGAAVVCQVGEAAQQVEGDVHDEAHNHGRQ